MSRRRFYIVDVFAEEVLTGNQLAVVTDAADLKTATMQRIARELNFSETTFLPSRLERDGGWDVRIFTPAEEIPFAGHPTLGTAWVIQNEILAEPRKVIALHLEVGRIPVRAELQSDGSEVLWMRQKPPCFGDILAAETAAALLGLPATEVDRRIPVQVVSTGLPCLIVPLTSLAAVKRARVDPERYSELTREPSMRAIFCFCPAAEKAENQIHARMFAPGLGVPEDPATGSANGCLAGYLLEHRYFGDGPIDVRVEQGYEIQRPSLLRLKAAGSGDRSEIDVGGRVFPVARGDLSV